MIFIFLVVAVFPVAPLAGAQEEKPEAEVDPGSSARPVALKRSDSPYLRLPEELLNAEPIRPYEGPPGPPVDNPTTTIGYDPATGREALIPAPADEAIEAAIARVEQYQGSLPANLHDPNAPASPIGADDRSRIYGTESFPWRTIARLAVK